MRSFTLFTFLMIVAACNKKSNSCSQLVYPGSDSVTQSTSDTTKPVMVPELVQEIRSYPYEDTFYGTFTHTAMYYPAYDHDTPMVMCIRYLSPTIIQFALVSNIPPAYESFIINTSGYYERHLSKKDYYYYRTSGDVLQYHKLDTHGPDYDIWDFVGRKR